MTTLSVLIGRMQPPHVGHIQLLKHMLDNSDHVLVLLGSSRRSRDTKNPWRWQYRANMALNLLAEESNLAFPVWDNNNGQVLATIDNKTVCFCALKDYPYSNNRWQYQVQKMVESRAEHLSANTVHLYGNHKDHSSWYLELFPRWERKEIPFYKPKGEILHATTVRDAVLRGMPLGEFVDTIGESGVENLERWLQTAEAQRLCDEAVWIDNFKKPYEGLPYPPIFQTADSVVTWRGLVLLGQRRGNPGKSLWALPGGYVNTHEWISSGAFRELGEEARTKVYIHGRSGRRRLKFDESWMVGSKTYDWPERSQRGRVITTRFHWRIPDHLDVVHEAADDLQRTQFFPIHDVLDKMDYELFEDHQMIIGDTVLRY